MVHSNLNLAQYLKQKAARLENVRLPRSVCFTCKRPSVTCYCNQIETFNSFPRFVILMHKDEVKRTIATGRMAHLCMGNSELYEGTNFTHCEPVNQIIRDPANYPVLLYPAIGAADLSAMTLPHRQQLFPADRKLVVFLIDGTWSQARKVKRISTNVGRLPTLCFTPSRPSQFRVRRQPKPNCYSTIEAIHELIDLLGPERPDHENLLKVFNQMVEKQINYETHFKSLRGFKATRGKRDPVLSADESAFGPSL